jgi:hypothetical protein
MLVSHNPCYCRDLKEDLNRQFRDKHPDLPPSLTLSKIRALKRQALTGCHKIGVEVSVLFTYKA